MKKKIILIIAILLVLLIIGLLLKTFVFNENKFNLDKEYYSTNGYVEISSNQVEKLIKNKKSYILFTYNNYCSFSKPCDVVFKNVAVKNNIEILQIPFDEFKKTSLYNKVKYAPSIIIIHNGKIVDYLDAEKDEDTDLYQNEDKFLDWLNNYIIIKEKN